MKGLEALEHIAKDGFNMIITTYPPQKAFDGITKGDMVEIIEKELKALEILKPCCIVADYKCENPEDRYELAFCKKICITEEEYNLLKEVLNYGV